MHNDDGDAKPASLGDSSRRWRRSWRCGGQGSRGGGGWAATTAPRSRLRWGTRRGGGGGGAGGCGGGESRGPESTHVPPYRGTARHMPLNRLGPGMDLGQAVPSPARSETVPNGSIEV
ncbi:hypothetical protein LWI29_004021 [Acer saccharum]|uniref:Uncharacterized protein n=1 Tax=Acer saccharum TaxID=4024 RepID=A0AA39RB31_ACESA|nr:hypothetical protein LWI29_004021 [Acer saccharum]